MNGKCACGAELSAVANEFAVCPRCGTVSEIALTQDPTRNTDPLRTFGYNTYDQLAKRGAVRTLFPEVPGYEVLGELGQGGMGLVLRARDPQLQRLIAIKVLHEKHRNSAELSQRFLEEAQITGQLQHPGIPPVHEVGTLPDGRPFLAMKLIQGRTLQELLKSRTSPQQDLPRFLARFEQVCQTLAYAHSRDVVHRDLKPGNIMVGAFGEVQVMDWGLAKVQSQEAAPDVDESEATVVNINTVRDDQAGLISRAGLALGTPAFMPPEQANGAIDKLDARCDVFGLGAILTVILTGKPPYTGASSDDVLSAARMGDLAAAYQRLAQCGADAELVDLARRCLAPRPADRPPNGGAVAQGVSAYLRGVQEKLQQAELERTAADLRVAHERKRRKLTAWIAALSVGFILLGVVAWVSVQRSQAAYVAQTTVRVNQELGRAQSLADEARKVVLTDGESRAASHRLWTDALAISHQAQEILQTAKSDEFTQQAVADTIAALRREANLVAIDREMLRKLDSARDRRMDLTNEDAYRTNPKSFIVYGHAAAAAYADAFREYGIDVVALPAQQAAEKIRASRIALQLAAALDDWLILTIEQPLSHQLVEVANAGDPDPFRSRLREACAREDGPALAQLGTESAQQAMSVPVTLLLADGLQMTNQRQESIRVLERAQQLHPDDFWINDILGVHLLHSDPSRADEAGRCFAAATARRPDLFFIHSNLGGALAWQGKFPEAKREFEAALRINPNFVQARMELAKVLVELGELEACAAICEETARLKPRDPVAVAMLAFQRLREGRELEALDLLQSTVKANPQVALAHGALGELHYHLRQLESAAEAFRAALALQPSLFAVQISLGAVLVDLDQLDVAEQVLAQALQQHPPIPEFYLARARLLFAKKKPDAALEDIASAIRLRPNYWMYALQFGDQLLANGKADRAILAYSRALDLKPDTHAAQFGLGECCLAKNEPLSAASHFQLAIAMDPKQARYHHSLGTALSKQGLFTPALPAYKQALGLEPEDPNRMLEFGKALQLMGNQKDAIPHLRRAVELMPKNAFARYLLGTALHLTGDFDGALAVFREAAEVDSQMAAVWQGLGHAYLQRKDFGSAVDAFRRAAEIDPASAFRYVELAIALRRQGRTEAALTEFRRAVKVFPGDARIYRELGVAYQEAGRIEEAQGVFRQAVWLDPENPVVHVDYGLNCLGQGNLDEALAAFERARQAKQPPPVSGLLLGKTLMLKGEFSRAQLTLGVASLQLAANDPATKELLPEVVNRCTALFALVPHQGEIQAGRHPAANATEALDCALFCAFTQHHSTAANYFQRAFTERPTLLEEPEVPLIAARAALGGGGESGTAAESVVFRRLALQWAEAALAGWQKNGHSWAEKSLIIGGLPRIWRHHPEFAGVQSPAARSNLPAAERLEWERFWDAADAFRVAP